MNRIFIIGGWRFEPEHLVNDWKKSFKWADKICVVDDRARVGAWGHEGQYRLLQRKELEKAGIEPWDWVFVTSPDERLEVGAEKVIRQEIKKQIGLRTYAFDLKEMFTPLEYRTDGIWGRKTRPRLYPYLPNQIFSSKRIQQAPVPLSRKGLVNQVYRRMKLDLNIYHLKMIEPENREARVRQYKAADPDYKYQPRNRAKLNAIDPEGKFVTQGYDYLNDLEGMTLEKIPRGRGYTPKYKKYLLS